MNSLNKIILKILSEYCAPSWYKQPSCLPPLIISVKPHPQNSPTRQHHLYSAQTPHIPATAAPQSLSTHMLSTKHVLVAIPRTIRAWPSSGKKKKKKFPFFLEYYPTNTLCLHHRSQTLQQNRRNLHTPYLINWEKSITQVFLRVHGRCT